jgi:molecular chaperone GrpE (heat shock protein)
METRAPSEESEVDYSTNFSPEGALHYIKKIEHQNMELRDKYKILETRWMGLQQDFDDLEKRADKKLHEVARRAIEMTLDVIKMGRESPGILLREL